MSVVIRDLEVVTDPQQPSQSAESAAAPAPPPANRQDIERLLQRLKQRAARLRAD